MHFAFKYLYKRWPNGISSNMAAETLVIFHVSLDDKHDRVASVYQIPQLGVANVSGRYLSGSKQS